MPDVEITIGGRGFEVSCEPGEEPYLDAAARLLDTEADALSRQVGRLSEARMLLMAGLMLADKTAGLEERLSRLEDENAGLQEEIERLKAAAAPAAPAPERIEVPVIPERVLDSFDALAARAESLAGTIEQQRDGTDG